MRRPKQGDQNCNLTKKLQVSSLTSLPVLYLIFAFKLWQKIEVMATWMYNKAQGSNMTRHLYNKVGFSLKFLRLTFSNL